MVIRALQIEDIELLSALYAEYWKGDYPSDKKKMKNLLTRLKDNSAYIFLCAVENERLIGYVSGIVCEDLYGDCEPFLLIENLVVEETERQNEIRGALCAELMNCAKLKGCTLTAFVTEKSKEKAGEFYESIGFNLAGYIGSKNRIND